MKVAIAISGLPRLYPISVASWGRIMGAYDPDVYIHTWTEPGADKIYLRSQLEWIFKTSSIEIDDPPEIDTTLYPDRHWPYTDVYRSQSMWRSIWNAHNMVAASGKEYDIIIRGRMDFHVHKLELVEFDGVIVPYCPFKIDLRFTYKGFAMHGLNDHLAYGNMHYMNLYANTLNEMLSIYRDDGVDYCPENLLAASLVKQGVPVMMQSMQHNLIRI